MEGERGSLRKFLNGINILLVAGDRNMLASMARILTNFGYKVTTAELGSKAVLMLAYETRSFDLVLVEAHLHDLNWYLIIQESIGHKIPTLLLSAYNETAVVAEMALQNGVGFYRGNSVTVTLESLWQYAKAGKTKVEDNKGGNTMRRSPYEEWDGNVGPVKRRKPYIRWTKELHAKFMDAAYQLEDSKRRPKQILKLMNEPGLTLAHISCHLQKCRQGNWLHLKTDTKVTHARKDGAMPFMGVASNTPFLLQPQQNEAAISPFEDLNAIFHNMPSMVPDLDITAPDSFEDLGAVLDKLIAFSSDPDIVDALFGADKTPYPGYLVNYQLPKSEDILDFSQQLGGPSSINCGSGQEDNKAQGSHRV